MMKDGAIEFLRRYWSFLGVFGIGMVSILAPSDSPVMTPALVALVSGVIGLHVWGYRIGYPFVDALDAVGHKSLQYQWPPMYSRLVPFWAFPLAFSSSVRADSRLEPYARRVRAYAGASVVLVVSLVMAAWVRSLV